MKRSIEFLSDSEKTNESWWSFDYQGETFIMICAMTEKPFRGISDIKAVYNEEHQNEQADLPDPVVSEVYAGVLDKSVSVI